MLTSREIRTQVIRALEVTDGHHGWHPHLHVLLLLQQALTEAEVATLRAMLAELWRTTVEHVVGRAYRPTLEHGLDLSRCHAAEYLTKLGLEVADAGQSKRARNVTGRSYWQMRGDWIANGKRLDDPDAARITEYFQGMLGAKIITWSKGQKKRAEALAAKPAEIERERASLHAEEWDAVRDLRTDDGHDARTAILRVAESAAPGQVDHDVRAFVDDLLRQRPSKLGPRHALGQQMPESRAGPAP